MLLFFADGLFEKHNGEFAETAMIGNIFGIKKVTALSASLITMIEPLMNPVWVFLFVHEIPSGRCIAGGIIILGFILLREFVSKSNSSSKTAVDKN